MYFFQVGLVGTDGSVRMISEVAEEEREALEAKVVEKSKEPIVIETCILRATLSTLKTMNQRNMFTECRLTRYSRRR